MITAVIAAASTLKGLLPPNKKDPERVATAQANLTKALAGDAMALAALRAQAAGSATQVGKDAAIRALDAYKAQTNNFTSPIPQQTPLQQTVSGAITDIGRVLGDTAQTIGAGAGTAVSNRLTGTNNAVTIPLTKTQLLIIGGIAAAILWLRR